MKFLLDSCISCQLRDALAADGHNAEWCGVWPEDPGDTIVLERAHAGQRVLITIDKDFGALAILKGQPHSGIIRLTGLGLQEQAPVMREIIRRHGEDLQRAAIVTATRERLRIRLPHSV
ncbi:MAG TPA: toxin-antitoxin system, toxin component, PIN family protein [Xanthomonadaceae bacterium]|nr:toxin-antitoxin system, toxin component, PIN family protein [Xanthomonadaceae bacterium]